MKYTAEIKTATKELVDTLLSMNTKNRNIKKSVVDKYKRDIEAGNWKLTNQGIGISSNGVLIDGQHRLYAIKEAGYPPVQLLVVSGLDEDAQKLVDQHAKRSARDLLLFAFDTRVCRHAPAIATCLLKSKTGKWNLAPTASELMQTILDYEEQISCVIQAPLNGGFYAAPSMAAFVLCIVENPSKKEQIVQFIQQVESGEMLNKTMPAFHLRNLVVLSRKNSGGGLMQQERFLKTVKATTAYINGESMGVLRV